MAMSARCGYSDRMSETDLQQPWMPDDSTFGARLALVRQRMGWGNIAKAAKECGVPVDSWRNWEVDGREPHRLVTIAMTIATRTGCDYLWLVHGPSRGAVRSSTLQYLDEGRVVAVMGDPNGRSGRSIHRSGAGRPVSQTRPMGPTRRPVTPAAV